MTDYDWSAMLAAEEERAMAGKPAWRVRAACVAGVACPRCMSALGVKCGPKSKPAASCRERVWAMRALQRAQGKAPMVSDVTPFLDVVANLAAGQTLRPMEFHGDLAWYAVNMARPVADADLIPAIRHGLVRLSVASDGAPVWVVTEAIAGFTENVEDHEKSEPAFEYTRKLEPGQAQRDSDAFLAKLGKTC